MEMVVTHVWTGLLSSVGQHACGDFTRAFLAFIFNLAELSFSYFKYM